MAAKQKKLRLRADELHQGSPGLHEVVAANMFIAARVSLARSHSPPKLELTVREDLVERVHQAELQWEAPDEKMVRSFLYDHERIEKAAECIALATLRARDDLVVWTRAESMSGCDWVLCPASLNVEQSSVLEVSGIEKVARPSEVRRRLYQKVQQVRRGTRHRDDGFSGFAVVVAIAQALVLLEAVPVKTKDEGER